MQPRVNKGDSQTENKNGFLGVGFLEEPFLLTNAISTCTAFSLSALLSLSTDDAHDITLCSKQMCVGAAQALLCPSWCNFFPSPPSSLKASKAFRNWWSVIALSLTDYSSLQLHKTMYWSTSGSTLEKSLSARS